MRKSYSFQDFVLNHSLKYYSFNTLKQRIEEFRQLDAREKGLLTRHWNSFGFQNEAEAVRAVDSIMQQSHWEGAWESLDTISCLNLNEGASIEMEVDYDKKIRLLFLGGFSFFVCNDDSGFLQYGDILIAINGGISCQQTVYFIAKRDGRPYPRSSTAVAFTPQTLCRSIGVMVEQSSAQPMEVSHRSLPFVYAWRACSDEQGHAWFPEECLTDNPEAAFCLDLTTGTFSLSGHLNPQIYNDEGFNLIRDIVKAVSEADGNDWLAIRLTHLATQQKGSFALSKNLSVLEVTERMIVTSD